MDHIHAHTCTASDTQLKYTNRKTTSHVRKKVDEFLILLWLKKKKTAVGKKTNIEKAAMTLSSLKMRQFENIFFCHTNPKPALISCWGISNIVRILQWEVTRGASVREKRKPKGLSGFTRDCGFRICLICCIFMLCWNRVFSEMRLQCGTVTALLMICWNN